MFNLFEIAFISFQLLVRHIPTGFDLQSISEKKIETFKNNLNRMVFSRMVSLEWYFAYSVVTLVG